MKLEIAILAGILSVGAAEACDFTYIDRDTIETCDEESTPFFVQTQSYNSLDGELISYQKIVHDHLTEWSSYIVSNDNSLTAVISASELSDELSRADLKIRCVDSFAGPSLDFSVDYVFAGGRYPGDEYAFDLFNSSVSGRPAAYDIGAGLVRTDGIEFSTLFNREQPPQEYIEAMGQLWTDLQLMSETSTVEVRFVTSEVQQPYVRLVFPMTGFSDVLQRGRSFCPTSGQ